MIGQAGATARATEVSVAPLFYTARFDLTGTAGERHVQSIMVAADAPVILEAVSYFADVFAGSFPLTGTFPDSPTEILRTAASFYGAARSSLGRSSALLQSAAASLAAPGASRASAGRAAGRARKAHAGAAATALTRAGEAAADAARSLESAKRLLGNAEENDKGPAPGSGERSVWANLARLHTAAIETALSAIQGIVEKLEEAERTLPPTGSTPAPAAGSQPAVLEEVLAALSEASRELAHVRLGSIIPDPLLTQICCHFGFESVRFLIAMFDENTGRELQNEFVHNMSALGPPGASDIRRLARPYRLPRRSVLRVEIQELFSLLHPGLLEIRDDLVETGMGVRLHVTFHGFREIGTRGD